MTTETLEDVMVQAEATATVETVPPALDADQAMATDRERVKQLAGRERGFQARARLTIGSIVANRMRANCDAFAHSENERPNIRGQTAKLFAIDLSYALGARIDDKEVYRLVRAHALTGLLPDDSGKLLFRLSWDAIRSLVRWVDWDQKEDSFSLRFSVDIGIKDDAGRTSRNIDACPMLAELVPALVASPKSAAWIRKIMDEREEQARQAELTFLNDRQRKQATAAKSMADRVKANEDRAALFDGFARRIVNAKLGADDVLDELFRRGLIPTMTNEIDPTALSQISADEASIVGKLLIQANNTDAIGALFAALKPIVDASDATQPSKGATLTLDALGSTRTLKTA